MYNILKKLGCELNNIICGNYSGDKDNKKKYLITENGNYPYKDINDLHL